MLIKFILFCLIGSLCFGLTAQSYRASRRSRNRRGTQTVSVEQKKTKEETKKKKNDPSAPAAADGQSSSRKPSAKFDPKKPVLTQKQIDLVMDGKIRKELLECRIREKMPGRKDDDDDEDTSEDEEKKEDTKKSKKHAFISRLDLSIMLSHYKSLIDNFELTEVSRIRPEWYQQFQKELDKFGPIINEMTIALRVGAQGRYADGVQKFRAHQDVCLKFLKEKPPRITKQEYQALFLKNTKIRQQNYLKKLREEREAAMKRRQEQLKQLQQKNQPQKKDQNTANKK